MDFVTHSVELTRVLDQIIELFNKHIEPHIDTIRKIKYPLNPGIRKCIYELILFDNDADVSPNKKLVIMYAFYDPYFSKLKALDGQTQKVISEYKKSLKYKIITVGFARAAAMIYKKILDDEAAARKIIITKWLESDTEMNTVDGGRNRKKRNSRKKHNSVKTPKRRPKSKKRKQV